MYIDRATGHHQCHHHLGASILERVKKALEADIKPGERIGIALSGGKDSTVLLYLLHTLCSERKDIELLALTVDEGIDGYREHSLVAAREVTRRFDIAHHVITFEQITGSSLDQLVSGREERSCTICGVLRRKALQKLARDHGVTVLATGHCLNDEAQTILMNCFRGDLPHLLRTTESTNVYIPRIKPLQMVSEKEITLYAMGEGIYIDLPECPYAYHALRTEVRTMLDHLELVSPGTMERILTFQARVAASSSGIMREIPLIPCDRCGEPCISGRCRSCTFLESP
ncbi:MAG: TIGR00269 family protein [Methanomicrobiales archaeon]|nr:TIGR00269 family protein [Methanomicrobiales archaeon]